MENPSRLTYEEKKKNESDKLSKDLSKLLIVRGRFN